MATEHVDERQEEAAVEAVAVEVLRRRVRGGDQHQAALEERGEEPRQDHRVGDVGDLKLVEAEEPRARGDFRRDRRDRVARLPGGAESVNAVLHLAHEFVEMDAPPGARRQREELVHQHGLAAADLAVDVEPFDRRGPRARRGAPASPGGRTSRRSARRRSRRATSATCAGSAPIAPDATRAA